MTLAIEPRSASEASVSGSGASALATLAIAIALKITETANQTKRRRTGTAGTRLLEVVDRRQLAHAVDADRGVGVERALEMREPAADVLVEEVAQEHAQARDLDASREPAVARADGQDGRQLVGDLQRRAEALEQVGERDRRRRRDVDRAASRTRSARAGRRGRLSPCGTVPECWRPRCRLSCSRDRRGNGSVDPCPHEILRSIHSAPSRAERIGLSARRAASPPPGPAGWP